MAPDPLGFDPDELARCLLLAIGIVTRMGEYLLYSSRSDRARPARIAIQSFALMMPTKNPMIM